MQKNKHYKKLPNTALERESVLTGDSRQSQIPDSDFNRSTTGKCCMQYGIAGIINFLLIFALTITIVAVYRNN